MIYPRLLKYLLAGIKLPAFSHSLKTPLSYTTLTALLIVKFSLR